jgi:hypothetical protein
MNWRTNTERWTCSCFVALTAAVIFPIVGEAQAALTPTQAEEKAEMLLGKKPDRVDSYFSKEGNVAYLAFAVWTPSRWNEVTKTETRAQEEIWIYEQDRGSNGMARVWEEHHLWPDMEDWVPVRYEVPLGFATVSDQNTPCLRLKGYFGGMHAGTNRLGLYCIRERRLFWVDYFSDFGSSVETGLQRVRLFEENAAEPQIKRYLLSWGHEIGLDVPPIYPSIDAARRVQQLWIDANGKKSCPADWTVAAVTKWKADRVDKLTHYTTRTLLKNPEIVLEDGPYQWLSYPGAHSMADVGNALAGVGRYDKQLRRYDLVYVPESTFNYSKELVVIGQWLYVQDCDHWAVRFNKVTHGLERGNFDDVVGPLPTGVYKADESGRALAPQPARGEPQGSPPTRAPQASSSIQQSPVQHQIYIPPGIDTAERDPEIQRHDQARIVLANPDLYGKLRPLERSIILCEAANLDRAEETACEQRAVLDEQRRQTDAKADFEKRFLNVPHPTVGQTRKMVHACNVQVLDDLQHRYNTIRVPSGTGVVITWVSGMGNSEGTVSTGAYLGKRILFMDSDLAPESTGRK